MSGSHSNTLFAAPFREALSAERLLHDHPSPAGRILSGCRRRPVAGSSPRSALKGTAPAFYLLLGMFFLSSFRDGTKLWPIFVLPAVFLLQLAPEKVERVLCRSLFSCSSIELLVLEKAWPFVLLHSWWSSFSTRFAAVASLFV